MKFTNMKENGSNSFFLGVIRECLKKGVKGIKNSRSFKLFNLISTSQKCFRGFSRFPPQISQSWLKNPTSDQTVRYSKYIVSSEYG